MEKEEQKWMHRMLKKERRKKNILLNLFIFVFVFGYMLFLTSSSWYPAHTDLIRPTAINKEQLWNDRTVTVTSWEYSEEQQLMEIKIEILNTSYDGIDHYEYEAVDRKKGFFKVTPLLEDEDYLVLHISDIDKRWSEISLRLKLPGGDRESSDTDQIKLYTNVDKVKRVDVIKSKTPKQYYADRINEKIERYQDLISKLTEENVGYQESINQAKENIVTMENKKEYQTDQEIKETEEIIVRINTEIDTMQSKVDENEATIIEYQERIGKAEEQMKNYQ